MIKRITKVYIRHYTDNDQRTLYVEWIDRKGRSGCTECDSEEAVSSALMRALVDRGAREGVRLEHETW